MTQEGCYTNNISLECCGYWHNHRYHKLKMWFDSSKLSIQTSKYNDSVVIIDPILSLRIYKWYNIPANLD